MNLRRARKDVPSRAIGDPFAVIPLRPDNVEVRKDSADRVHLRLTPRLKDSYRKLAGWLRYDYTRRVELDATGSLYFQLVDGQRTLGEIVESLVSRLDKPRPEVEPMVVLFTKHLMTRNLLLLKVPGQESDGGAR